MKRFAVNQTLGLSLSCVAAMLAISGCRQQQPEVRSLLSFQDDWDAARNENPYLVDIAHRIVARTDSLRQNEVAQVLAKNGINDVVALLEFESPGGNLKGIYTVFVIARRSVYRIRIYDHGRDVTELAISKSEVSEAARCIDALRGYKGNDIPAACDLDMVFVTTYKNKKAATMFFAYMMTLDAKRTWAKHGSPQGRIFYRLCEILLLAPSGDVTSEMTDVSYPRFWKDMANKDVCLSLSCAFRAGLFSVVFALSGCRQPQPEVRSLLSFPETWEAARNSDRLFCDYARKVAEETDPVREKLFTQFLASNRVSDVVMLLEYANPVNLREYRMIVVTKRGAYCLSRFENGDTATSRIGVSVDELSEIQKCVGALHGYQSECVIRKSAHSPCVLFVTLYVKQKVAEMFFSDTPMLGVKRMVGVSRNPQYPTFQRLCDILLLAKSEDGVVPEFTLRQAAVQAIELGRKICSDDSRLL